MPFGKKQDRKIAGDDPNPFSLYFLILCLLAFLFSLLCAVWHSKRVRVSPNRTSAPRASDLEIYFYVFPYCVPASLFIFFTSCCLAKKKNNRKIAGDDPNPFSLYFLILCLLAFLFSLLCAVWHSKRVSPNRTSAPRASDLEIYFYVFPYCVPASLFIFFTSCRLAKNKIAKSQETIQIHFLCIFLFCAC